MARLGFPAINASLNATATVLLSTGYVFIRRRRIAAHRACMIAAFAASSLFLITYLIHHARVGSVPFHGAAWLRPVYFGLRPAHRAGGARGAAGADDHPPRVARPLRPPPAAGACDAAHLALRLGQRRSGLRSPLSLRSLSPLTVFLHGGFARASTTSTASRHTSARRTSRAGRYAGKIGSYDDDEGGHAVVYFADPIRSGYVLIKPDSQACVTLVVRDEGGRACGALPRAAPHCR